MAENWIRTVGRVVEGDRAAFLRLARLVTGFLRQWRAYDFRDEWDDLIQEVVLAAVQAVQTGRLRRRSAFVPYVRSIARNKFVDRLRRSGREVAEMEDAPGAVYWPLDPTADPEAREIWRAVSELPEKQRQAVLQVYREGRTQEEAARETGIPLGSLKRYLREALSALESRYRAPHEDG